MRRVLCHAAQQMLSAASAFPGPFTTRERERAMLTKISLGSGHDNFDCSCSQRLSADGTPGRDRTVPCRGLHQGFWRKAVPSLGGVCGGCDTTAALFAQMFALPLEEVRGRSPEPAWSP